VSYRSRNIIPCRYTDSKPIESGGSSAWLIFGTSILQNYYRPYNNSLRIIIIILLWIEYTEISSLKSGTLKLSSSWIIQ
jgi:hypothetical protein